MAYTFLADIKNQRLSCGTPRVEAREVRGGFRFQRPGVDADCRFIEKRQPREVRKRMNVFCFKSELRKQGAVVGDVCVDFAKKGLQPGNLIFLQPVAAPPL